MSRLLIEPLTRVEGHGRVELLTTEAGLEDVRVRLLESPRLFEAMVVGRRFDEVPDLVCRICAICSAVHKLTSLRALEQALEVNVPPLAERIREMLLLGGHLQSHALHLFCLILPDFSGDASLVDLLKRDHPLAKVGLDLKAFGNQVQEIAGGRVIHPVNPVVGGVVYRPAETELKTLLTNLDDWQSRWPEHAERFRAEANYPVAQDVIGIPLATGQPTSFALSGDSLWCGTDSPLPVGQYGNLLGEQSADDTYAKQSGKPSRPLLVGAQARLKLLAQRGISTVLAADHDDIHANNTAQLHEIGWTLDRLRQVIEEICAFAGNGELRISAISPQGGVGTAAMEAPRGLLIHHYVVDEWGHIVAADVVTPTAINQLSMRNQILADLAGQRDSAVLKDTAEKIIRSFDPCISCAVHVMRYDGS